MSTSQNQRKNVADNMEQPVASTSAQSQQLEVSRVGIKPPAFCREQPDLLFLQLESQFAIVGITTAPSKYHHVITLLEPQHFIHINEIIRDPSVMKKHHSLIKEHTDSNDRKLNNRIHEMQLGDLKPLQLL